MRPEAEFTISQADVARLIESRFPELSPLTLRVLGEGWDNVAWLVNDEFVFRLPRRQMGADCLAGEITVLPHLVGRLPIPFPELLYIGESSDRFPWPYAGYRLLEGTPLDELQVDSAARQPLARALGEVLRILHSIPLDEVRGWGTQGDLLGRMNVPKRIEGSRKLLAEAEGRGALDDARRWESILADAERLQPQDRKQCLVHGDLYAKHLLVQPDEQGHLSLSGIIDWGDVHLGEPSGDLAAAFSLFATAQREELFAAYGPVDEQTAVLARLRALNHSLHCLLGCGDDEAFRTESRLALDHILT